MKKVMKAVIGVFSIPLLFLSYLSGIFDSTGDVKWVVPVARSFIERGDLNIDEFSDMLKTNDFTIVKRQDHTYTIFPYGTSIMAAPLLLIIDALPVTIQKLQIGCGLRLNTSKGQERIIASFFMSISAFLIFLIAYRYSGIAYAVFFMLLFAFCTPAWSTASRALWQHGPSILLLTLALFLIDRPNMAPVAASLTAIFLCFSFVVRPTNVIPLLALSIYVIKVFRKIRWIYFSSCLTVLLGYFIFNKLQLDVLLPEYYLPTRIGHGGRFFEALFGHLISPARGLLVYCPYVVFTPLGLIFYTKNNEKRLLTMMIFVTILLHWLVISTFPHWWGGWCFGPRLFADMTPFLLFLLIPLTSKEYVKSNVLRRAMVSVLFVFAVISFFIHYQGSMQWGPTEWNARPVNIDEKPSRLWDWHDVQFLRGVSGMPWGICQE
ncbi:hypothetical protein JW979_11930 [bacterium]|nr:hypothetical protein [candidate division CSSED10-310 bacterium]